MENNLCVEYVNTLPKKLCQEWCELKINLISKRRGCQFNNKRHTYPNSCVTRLSFLF